MESLQRKIEALLFLESKPFTFKKLAHICSAEEEAVATTVTVLQGQYEQRGGGVTLVIESNTVQLMTAPAESAFIQQYIQEEETGELTRPSLETLTIIAYRGPVPKTEIELIRGVNCSLILRNLMIRGLVEEVGETEIGTPVYSATIEFLRYLGLNKITDLPNYEELNKNVHLQELLAAQQNPEDFFQQAV
ncbi:MAG: SMC-Scp complex subunit ScpB [Candidatus Kerfeldbacteria bacterium]|nr:SMC-Scp complex subunit ScpB [Candidatus Kerfeldbacteria bacterium]